MSTLEHTHADRNSLRAETKPFRASTWIVLVMAAVVAAMGSCSTPQVKPVDIYPEDMCALCKMAFSDQRYASEIISQGGEVFKFDDIGCMEEFKTRKADLTIAAVFYKDFETNRWIQSDKAYIIATHVTTPMGSGRLAFADSVKAKEFLHAHRGR